MAIFSMVEVSSPEQAEALRSAFEEQIVDLLEKTSIKKVITHLLEKR